jgi:hypothetical protein
MPAYTDASRIAGHLGVTLTGAQQTQAGILAQAATDWIDEYKGRSWQAVSPVTGEVQPVNGDRVYLDHRPVVAITSVETRGDYVGGTYATLAAGQYDLLDATNGVLQLIGWGTYLAGRLHPRGASTPPPVIALAATMIAASWLHPALNPSTAGLDSVAVGQNDVNVKFSATVRNVPPEALVVLGARGFVVA